MDTVDVLNGWSLRAWHAEERVERLEQALRAAAERIIEVYHAEDDTQRRDLAERAVTEVDAVLYPDTRTSPRFSASLETESKSEED